MDDFEVILEPLGDDGHANIGGHYRHKNKPGQTYRRVLLDRGDILSARVTLALLAHGTITPNGEEASLLVFDVRLVSNRAARRFIRASFQLIFRDAAGNQEMDPDIYRIAPEGAFSIDPNIDAKTVRTYLNLSAKLGVPYGGVDAGGGRDTEAIKTDAHAIQLEGQRKVLERDWGDDNAVIWTMREDAKEKKGTPSFLRAALILRRKADRPFAFSLEADTEASFSVGHKLKTLWHSGKAEKHVPAVEDSVVTAPIHVLRAEDPLLSEYVKKVDWSNLHALNLHEDLVVGKMRGVLGAQPMAVDKAGPPGGGGEGGGGMSEAAAQAA